ncbi:MAG: DIP1984 family protein [Pirellulaceae bacterium]|nr:DIP1984 family protein [Pirellulaceae bacterium]
MKLAEALILRADMKKKLDSMRERMKGNCLVQEGEEPHEDPQALLEDSFRLLQEHEQLICKINRANLSVKLSDGRSIMEAIAERDRLVAQHTLLKEAAASARKDNAYYSNSEIKWKAVVKVPGLEKQADDLSKKIRELNTAIQSVNWASDMPEK